LPAVPGREILRTALDAVPEEIRLESGPGLQ
jgi:hypothetical protein